MRRRAGCSAGERTRQRERGREGRGLSPAWIDSSAREREREREGGPRAWPSLDRQQCKSWTRTFRFLTTLREPVPGARVGSSVAVVARPCPSRSESAMRKFKTVLKRTATMAPLEVDEGAGGSAPHPTEPDQRARRDNGNAVEAASMPPPPPPMRRSRGARQGRGRDERREGPRTYGQQESGNHRNRISRPQGKRAPQEGSRLDFFR